MLNITNNSISSRIDLTSFKSYQSIMNRKTYRQINKWLIGFLVFSLIMVFMPWTQNVKSDGALTTLEPQKRPQAIVSVIPGRIENWFVTEGESVTKGDTIAVLSETKDVYFDPKLVERTQNQIDIKTQSVEAYESKAKALESQILALQNLRTVKLESLQIKEKQLALMIASDSADLAAYDFAATIADKQADRANQLYKDGLRSLTDVEVRDVKRQETSAGRVAKENKLAYQKQELQALKLQFEQTRQEFNEKIAKAESDRFTAISAMNDAITEIQKLEISLVNYEMRRKNLVITAPQSGVISRMHRAGIGETVKEGEQLATLLPSDFSIAAAIYVKPIDLPLISKGQKVRLVFDGWPALVFSGWPNVSYGTYGGVVSMIESQTSVNGYYRVLVTPDPSDYAWPNSLQLGSGVRGMSLLSDVPVWYEMWRQINGFPPSFYKQNGEKSASLGAETLHKKSS
ncbi:HlyD family efflux transporter periplasmic adaptor subunit [bacterium]|nr:MAG: HlyD family efflux transporter periplasmic adaptor subunit [bacterium]